MSYALDWCSPSATSMFFSWTCGYVCDRFGSTPRGQWDQVWDQVWGLACDLLLDQVWGQVWDRVWELVWEYAWDQLWDQVCDQLWDQVWALCARPATEWNVLQTRGWVVERPTP